MSTTSPLKAIHSDRLPPAVGPFSPAIRAGDFLFFSGQVGVDPSTGKLREGGIEAQAHQLFQNLATLLDAAGRSFGDVVKASVFLTRIEDYQAVNVIYARHFSEPFPARTAVGVAALPLGACVEIDIIAKARGSR
jgi:2-iminobutanoate/2-iminopropanoate deaminase